MLPCRELGLQKGFFLSPTPQIDFQAQIPSNKSDFLKFEADLQNYAGPKGVKSFMKLLEGHVPWRDRTLTVYIEKGSTDEYTNWILEEHQIPYCEAIITPSEKENRIYGHVTFAYGALRKLYSIYPLNVNILGASCPKLKVSSKLQGRIVEKNRTWLDFAVPTSLHSFAYQELQGTFIQSQQWYSLTLTNNRM